MLTPQEIQIWYLLPVLRRDIAKKLMQKGWSQKEIASLMDITPSTISQYLHNKRASKLNIKINDAFIEILVNKLLNKEYNYSQLVQYALTKLTKLTCEIHHKLEKIKECCGICYGGDKNRGLSG